MKKPKEHYIRDDDFEDVPGSCNDCGQEWPCTTWRRWVKSKDYRIDQLEAAVKRLTDQAAAQAGTLIDLQRTVRDDSNILRNGICRAMADLGRHGRMGDLTLKWERDYPDVSPAFDSHRVRVARPAKFTVIYKDAGGRTWTNGRHD